MYIFKATALVLFVGLCLYSFAQETKKKPPSLDMDDIGTTSPKKDTEPDKKASSPETDKVKDKINVSVHGISSRKRKIRIRLS